MDEMLADTASSVSVTWADLGVIVRHSILSYLRRLKTERGTDLKTDTITKDSIPRSDSIFKPTPIYTCTLRRKGLLILQPDVALLFS